MNKRDIITDLKLNYRNCIIEYKGGGYDGCIWEWNYFLINEKGEFVDIAHSGALGGSSFEQVEDRLTDRDWNSCNLEDEKSIEEFISSSSHRNVMGVAKWVNEHTKFHIQIPCDTCKEKVDPEDIILVGQHGIGGIMTDFDGFECQDCYCSNTCANCGERVGLENLDKKGFCEYCSEEMEDK